MPCFTPIYGWQKPDGGPVLFGAERPNTRRVDLPCGYCLGCRLKRSRNWAIRCMHEAQMHPRNCFITLTYDEAHYVPGLEYQHYQQFMRRLRRKLGYFDVTLWQHLPRFFACGEYGDKFKRPHFHAILFGVDFHHDRQNFGHVDTSKTLDQLWGKGFTSVGNATAESAGYVARYSVKKVFGDRASDHYKRVDTKTGEIIQVSPEFAHMSLKPGIGQSWFSKYWQEIYGPRDGVVMKGGKCLPAPNYYDKLLQRQNEDLRDWKSYERYVKSKQFIEDTTPERLLVKLKVTEARLKQRERNLE